MSPEAIGESRRQVLVSAVEELHHRGPDASGIWIDDSRNVGLGHRRLSILDLTESGDQPMSSPAGRFTVVYNGELYNFPKLRDELQECGFTFHGTSDTEVLVAGFEQWGVAETIQKANGMFAFGAWDGQDRTLHLVRDRMGQKPLYYGKVDGTFVFASELEGLPIEQGFDPSDIDAEGLEDLLRYGYIPSPGTIFRGIRKLPPGAHLQIQAEDITTSNLSEPTRYWSLPRVARKASRRRFDGSLEEATDLLEETLRDAVARRMVADVPLGAFLSGGIDSSTIVALMQGVSDEPVRTFTIGFHEAPYNEAEEAKKVAEHLGTNHTERYLSAEEAIDVIEKLPTLYDEPFADQSQIPTHLVSRLAREEVKVVLSGDGGDELFGGYNRYSRLLDIWGTTGRIPSLGRRVMSAIFGSVPTGVWDGVVGSVQPVLPSRLRVQDPGDKLHKLANVLDCSSPMAAYEELLRHWPEIPTNSDGDSWVSRPMRDRYEAPPDLSLLEQMMLLDAQTYLADRIHTKVDRASMGVGLETRAPFMDPNVVRLSWRLPTDMKMRDHEGKIVVRKLLSRYIPRDLIDRPKRGFGVPIHDWLRGPLEGWAGSLLDPARLEEQGLIDSEIVQRRWAEHQDGKRNWAHLLWDVLMFQLWWEENLDLRPPMGLQGS